MALGVSSVTINGTTKSYTVSPSPSPGPAGSVSPPQVGGTYSTPSQLGFQATATATVGGGGVTAINVVSQGKGYTSVPTVIISGGGGSGATATATLVNGMVTAITVNTPGTGYTSTPTITVAPGLTPAQLAGAQPQGNTDVSGRPLFPSLYITDITGATAATIDNLQYHVGDWQYGGTPVAPNTVFGTWKSFSETINTTTSPPTVTLSTTGDPAANGTNLGPGADPLPSGFTSLGYTAEAQWNLAQLQADKLLIPGHVYRFYMIVHDGDQNKSGGDVGQACVDLIYTPPPPPPPVTIDKAAESTTAAPGGSVTYDYTVTNNTSSPATNIIITDDLGIPNNPNAITIAGPLTLAPGQSEMFTKTIMLPFGVVPGVQTNLTQVISSATTPVGTLSVTQIPTGQPFAGNYKIVFNQDTGIVDNTYGTNASAGWGTKGHKFTDLTGSDQAEFQFTNKAGNVILDFDADYVSAAPTSQYPSGYGTLGFSGGDGKFISGTQSAVLNIDTTITDDLNTPGNFGFTTNSPANPAAVGWNVVDGYTVIVSKAYFDQNGGFGGVTIPFVHDSPSKIPSTIKFTPSINWTNTATVTGTVVIMGVSGPTKDTDTATVLFKNPLSTTTPTGPAGPAGPTGPDGPPGPP
jgi:uncharacterized repeat protein (TIGR01451 family)